jgi:hypothetical protein
MGLGTPKHGTASRCLLSQHKLTLAAGRAALLDFRVRASAMRMTFQTAMALLAAAAPAWAEPVTQQPPTEADDTSSIILAAKPTPIPQAVAPRPTSPERAVSPAIAANLSLGMPAYVADLSAPKAGNPAADLRDLDKPKNQIPRLPIQMMQRYVVRESRVPVFRPRDLYTTAGLIDLSFKEHPGLRFGNFFNLNAKVAYETVIEEQLAADRRELADIAIAMAIGGDSEEAALMQKAINDSTFSSEEQQGPVKMK